MTDEEFDKATPAEREAASVADGIPPDIAAAFRRLEEKEEAYERAHGPGSLARAGEALGRIMKGASDE